MPYRWLRLGLIVAVLGMAGAVDARAQTERDGWIKTCQDGEDPEARITACTALLLSGQETRENEAVLLVYRGAARAAKHEYDAALTDFDQAIGRDPDQSFAYFQAGLVYDELGQYDKAIRAYDNVLRLTPDDAPALNNRCWARVLSFDPAWALPDCEAALQLAPNDPDTLDSRGYALLLLGRLDEAVASFTAAIAARANQPTAFYGRALAKMAVNRQMEAASDLAAARRIDPDIDSKLRRWGMSADNPPCLPPGACPKQ
jgi:tetratricopeptide (TPR) repeat protein